MKKLIAAIALCCVTFACRADDNPFRPTVIAECRDGTRVQIQPRASILKLATEYAAIDLDFSLLDRVLISSNSQARAELTNGDRLCGELRNEFVEARTLAGEVKLPVSSMAVIEMFRPGRLEPDLWESMLLYFPFDDDAGRGLTNAGREKVVATTQNTAWSADGVAGGAMYFSRENSWMAIGNSPAVNAPVFSFCFWAKAENLKPMSTSSPSPYGILGKHRVGDDNQSYYLVCWGDGTIALHISGSKTVKWNAKITAPSDLVEGKWCFLAIVNDGAWAYFYVNGESMGKCDVEGYKGNSYDLLVGAAQCDSPGEPRDFWHGWIDEFRMFDRALTPAQVERLYRHDLWRAGKIACAGEFSAVPSNALPLKIQIDISDGSLLKGELLTERLDMDNTPAGAINIPIEYLASIRWEDTNGTAAVVLRNGDVWRGVLRQAEFEVATQLGGLRVKREFLRVLAVKDAEHAYGLLPRLGEPDPAAAGAAEISRLVSVLLEGGAAEKSEAAKQLLKIGAAAAPALEEALAAAAPDRRWWLEAMLEQIKKQENTR